MLWTDADPDIPILKQTKAEYGEAAIVVKAFLVAPPNGNYSKQAIYTHERWRREQVIRKYLESAAKESNGK